MVSMNFHNKIAQGLYSVVILAVTLANIGLNHAVEKANEKNDELKKYMSGNRKWLICDMIFKVIGILVCLTVLPFAPVLTTIITGVAYLAVVGNRNPKKRVDEVG